LSRARVEGAEIGSAELTFVPGEVVPGEYEFDVGTAGSTTLVFQTVLPPLLLASGPSLLTFVGGTHNPMAPPFEFLDRSYLPLVRRTGAVVEAALERSGFYPAGGGRFSVTVEPCPRLAGFELLARGEIRRRRATALLSNLPRHIAERELRRVAEETGWEPSALEVREVEGYGPGNILLLEVESDHVTEVLAGFGERGVPAERVADRALLELRRYLDADVPVGEHLADQLLLLLALAGSGAFATLPLSGHAATQVNLIPRFLDVRIDIEEKRGRSVVRVEGVQPV
jgi:RNA 3'-terminal phosphate cyclase (ATP)